MQIYVSDNAFPLRIVNKFDGVIEFECSIGKSRHRNANQPRVDLISIIELII